MAITIRFTGQKNILKYIAESSFDACQLNNALISNRFQFCIVHLFAILLHVSIGTGRIYINDISFTFSIHYFPKSCLVLVFLRRSFYVSHALAIFTSSLALMPKDTNAHCPHVHCT